MSNLEKEKRRARRLSTFQKAVSFLTYFLILGLIIINTYVIMNNWGVRFSILPTPVSPYTLVMLGLTLLSSLIILQTMLMYQLYKLKKEAQKNKNQNSKNQEDNVKYL
ncbi:MAG: hypothetical protein QW279_10975 [Candidatus Jordarchaeaceae archaeon]